jgi:hypothetical protein
VGIREWLVGRLGGDDVVGDPAQLVEVGLVALAVSEIVLLRLAEEGIDAVAHEQAWYGSPFRFQTRPMARVMVRLADLERARPIVDEVSTGW